MSAERSDVDVLAAVADGDRQALRVLYDRHAPWLALRLARRCADPGVVDETLQDTFMAVWRSAGRYKGSGDVGAWMWGIAIRRLIDALRRLPRSEVLVAEVDDRRSAEEEVLLGVEYGDFGGALQRLSPQLRAVVQATVLDGLTSREAGRLLGIPSGTVKTRMMRARAQLREELA
jgi:RNA polymerase sigma-70 factor (ECF subfamily)